MGPSGPRFRWPPSGSMARIAHWTRNLGSGNTEPTCRQAGPGSTRPQAQRPTGDEPMTPTEATFTESDLRLIDANFKTLSELCAAREIEAAEIEGLIDDRVMPQPAYTLPDG